MNGKQVIERNFLFIYHNLQVLWRGWLSVNKHHAYLIYKFLIIIILSSTNNFFYLIFVVSAPIERYVA